MNSSEIDLRKEAVPVVYDGKRYGYKDTICIQHLYKSHHGDNAYLFHPAHEPWEIAHSETSPMTLNLSKKQARQLRDLLAAMDLSDPEEKS